MSLKIGISGKRKINTSDLKTLGKKIENNIRAILETNKTSDFIGYTALAIGADTIFAEVVTNVFNMPLQVVLPMPLEEYQKDFEEPDLPKQNSFIEKNSETVIVSEALPANQEDRNEAYFNAGKYIVDNCDEMIFVWDEMKPVGKGGTAEIIGYYGEEKMKVALYCIIVQSQNKNSLNNKICQEYEFTNKQAIQSRNDYKLIWKLAIFLGWLAVVFFSISTAFDTYLREMHASLKFIGVCLEFLLVLTVFILIMKAKAKNYHGNYLSKRSRAETLRVLKCFYHADIEIKISDLTSITDKELSAIVQEINDEIKTSTYTSKWYANYVIKLLIQEQMNYHVKKVKDIGSKFHLFENLNLGIAIFFMINLTAHLVNEILLYFFDSHLNFYSHEIIILFSILLPATYASIEGFLYFQEWGILKKYSTSVGKSLQESIKELPINIADQSDKNCFAKQSITLNLVTSAMLTDNKNWHLILEDKNNYHWVV